MPTSNPESPINAYGAIVITEPPPVDAVLLVAEAVAVAAEAGLLVTTIMEVLTT